MRLIDADALAKKYPWIVSRSMKFNLDLAPTIDAVPVVHAGWKDQDYTFTRFQCTACKSINHSIMTKYCPDCGARMDGEEHAAD